MISPDQNPPRTRKHPKSGQKGSRRLADQLLPPSPSSLNPRIGLNNKRRLADKRVPPSSSIFGT